MQLRVPAKWAEQIRRHLAAKGILDREKRSVKNGDSVLFPITGDIKIDGCQIVDGVGPKKDIKPKSLAEALAGVLTDEEIEMAPTAFNIVGDIAVFELDERLSGKGAQIGNALMMAFPNVKTVCKKTGMVNGTYRVPALEVIAGQNRTDTVHRENGVRLHVDISKSYFNPRTGTERARVTSLVKKGENILVMFAGVGPYAIQLAKAGANVSAIEINPSAVSDMQKNAKMNKVDMDIILGDVRQEVPNLGKFARIIMPLPKIAIDYLDIAVAALAEAGTIHYYSFAHDEGEAIAGFTKRLTELQKAPSSLNCIICGAYSPCLSKFCIDASLN